MDETGSWAAGSEIDDMFASWGEGIVPSPCGIKNFGEVELGKAQNVDGVPNLLAKVYHVILRHLLFWSNHHQTEVFQAC